MFIIKVQDQYLGPFDAYDRATIWAKYVGDLTPSDYDVILVLDPKQEGVQDRLGLEFSSGLVP